MCLGGGGESRTIFGLRELFLDAGGKTLHTDIHHTYHDKEETFSFSSVASLSSPLPPSHLFLKIAC